MLRFSWDRNKAASNSRKHGVSFEIAVRVFSDPFALTEQDRVEAGEYRWQTLGMIEGGRLIVVAHTAEVEDEADTIRIISARRAQRHERRRYEEEKYRNLRV